MSTSIKTLGETDSRLRQQLHEVCLSIYLDGECYAFATALHEGLGWQMVGLCNRNDGEIRHAMVVSPKSGRHFDARGFVQKGEISKPFTHGIYSFFFRKIHPCDLVRDGESPEARLNSVAKARMIAEVLWPNLPWKESAASKMRAFVEELEALSRKHGIWIRASLPAVPPSLAIGEGGENGYIIYQRAFGVFSIDRRLSRG